MDEGRPFVPTVSEGYGGEFFNGIILCSEPETAVLRPVACDPVPGAGGKGQGPKPDRGRAAAALRLSGRVGTLGQGRAENPSGARGRR